MPVIQSIPTRLVGSSYGLFLSSMIIRLHLIEKESLARSVINVV